MQSYDAIVVGAGGVGSATMLELSRRGVRVLGVDRFRPPHTRGSSHGETRAIRQAYFEHSDYVPLLLKAYELWDQLQQTSGEKLFEQCGLLEVGPEGGEVVGGVLHAATQHTLQVERLAAAEVSRCWPSLCVPDDLTAVFEPTAGYLHVERCVRAMLAEAQRHGAELVSDCDVKGWATLGDGVEVVTSRGVFRANHLAITAGAWAGELLAELGIPLTVLRKSLFWYSTEGIPQSDRLPVFLYEMSDGVPYGFPSLDGVRLKIAEHSGGLLVDDPLNVNETIPGDEQQTVERFLSECVTGSNARLLDHTTCLYTMTPDHHFVVDRHPIHSCVAFAAGLSGHGYKFAPVLGVALADLLLEGTSRLPIEFLSTSRFSS